jgi:hypothetical protein
MRFIRHTLVAALLASLAAHALAGEIACTIKRGGLPAAGVKVGLTPGSAVKLTDAQGKCSFTGLAAGKFCLRAGLTVAGKDFAAIKDPVNVPATGSPVVVALTLVTAIRVSQYMPLKLGNQWVFSETSNGAPQVRTETVTGTKVVSGATTTIVRSTWAGSTSSSRVFWRSWAGGFGMYGDADASDTRTYVPPVIIADPLPLNYTGTVQTSIQHTNGAFVQPIKVTYVYTGLETVTAPAGPFASCPRLECKLWLGTTQVGSMTMWLAAGVGIVKAKDTSPTGTTERLLKSYKLVP